MKRGMERFRDHIYEQAERSFLKQKNVYAYRGDRISDIPDRQIGRVCHRYCEENGLMEEFSAFRETFLMTTVFCPVVTGGPACNGRHIEKTLCEDIQMGVGGAIKKQTIPEYKQVDWERAQTVCPQCRHVQFNLSRI